MWEPIVTEAQSKFYKIFRNKLKVRMHKNRNKSFLRIAIKSTLAYYSVEIDEIMKISSNNEIKFMFGIVDW